MLTNLGNNIKIWQFFYFHVNSPLIILEQLTLLQNRKKEKKKKRERKRKKNNPWEEEQESTRTQLANDMSATRYNK
jgi:hypothetical protein